MLSCHANNFELSSKNVPLSTHQIDIDSSNNVFAHKDEPLLVNDEIIEAAEDLSSQLIEEEHSEEQIITEISSADCLVKKKKRLLHKVKRDDHPYGCVSENLPSTKIPKIKKEKVVDGIPIIRKR